MTCEINDSTREYINSLKDYKPLSKKEERKLLRQYKKNNDIKARNRLITSNLKFASSMATSYLGRGLTYQELVSEANDGLIDGIEHFDIRNDVKLISYSKWWIMQHMQSAIEKRNKMPISELPADTDTDEEDYYDELPCVAGNKKDEYLTVAEEEDLEEEEKRKSEYCDTLLSILDKRSADMLNKYFGRGTEKSMTLQEIGAEYGLTKERVRKIIESSLLKVRSQAVIEQNENEPYL